MEERLEQLAHLTYVPLIGIISAALISAITYRMRLLTKSGAIAALFVGSLIFAAGGWRGAIPLLVFFVSSNLWGRWRRDRKSSLQLEKEGPRDAAQVLANSAVAAIAIVSAAMSPERSLVAQMAFAASLAEANADTWATEIGAACGSPPRLITTWKRVPHGRSGAVSLIGTSAALAGAALVAVSSVPLLATGEHRFAAVVAALTICAGSGFAGVLADSVLGATLQSLPSQAGEGNRQSYKGSKWINNDLVNLLATLVAAAAAAAAGVLAGLWAN